LALDVQSQAVVDALNASGIIPFRTNGSPTAVREKVLSLRVAKPETSEHQMASVTEETVTTRDGSFRVRVMRPRTSNSPMPVVLYFHGGGFFAGGIDETDELARKLAKGADAVVVNVDYHLSPEAKFPVAVNDAYASLCWVVESAARLGVDPDRLVLAGDSAGGNLTIVTCLQARERGGPKIVMQVPIYASVDMRERPHYASRERLGRGGYILDNDDIEWMLDAYLNDRGEASDWRASPILANSFADLPPALIVTADHDPLVDEGALYAERLQAAGVAAEHVCFEGTFHGFIGYAAVLEVGARGIDLVCDRIRKAVAA
jgi:acetyl esterase